MFRSTSLFDETVLILGLETLNILFGFVLGLELEGDRFETVNLPIFCTLQVLDLIPSNFSTAHNLICMSFVIIYL